MAYSSEVQQPLLNTSANMDQESNTGGNPAGWPADALNTTAVRTDHD